MANHLLCACLICGLAVLAATPSSAGGLGAWQLSTEATDYAVDVTSDAAGNYITAPPGPVPAGPPFRVSDEPGGRRQPAVATAAAGDFVLVWKSRNEQGQARGVFGRLFDAAGVGRGPTFPITDGEVDNPAVSVAAGGNVLVVWEAPYSVRGRWFNREGEALGEAFTIVKERTGLPWSTIRFPKVAGLSTGNAVVIWLETLGGIWPAG